MKVILSWSSGKDSAWALHVLRQTAGVEVAGLLTTIGEASHCVPAHGVHRTLVEAQAGAAGLALHVVPLPVPCSNEIYRQRFRAFIAQAQTAGIAAIAFGDLFLEDMRVFREELFAASGVQALFPLWQKPTAGLAQEIIAGGLKARVVSVDPKRVAPDVLGREFDAALLHALPTSVDPCGENGEFHTFAYAGPMFQQPMNIEVGAPVASDGLIHAALKLAD